MEEEDKPFVLVVFVLGLLCTLGIVFNEMSKKEPKDTSYFHTSEPYISNK